MDDQAPPPPEAIARLLAALCPAILLLRVSGRVEIGSSTLVRVGPRFLLATAAHNLDDARDEEIRLVPAGRTTAAPIPFLRRSLRRRSDPADVAWVELAAETVANHGLGFVELSGVGGGEGVNGAAARRALGEDFFVVEGYPAERVLATALDGASVRPMGFVTLAARGRPGELTVLYPPPTAVVAECEEWPAQPHGISGGGIWSCPPGDNQSREPTASGDVVERTPVLTGDRGINGAPWHATTRLVAIARGWRRQRGTLHGTHIEQWLLRVLADRPELRNLLQDHLR